MTVESNTFEGLLRRFPAFQDLGDERLGWLAARSRPFHCTVGQELLRPDRMPEFCFCIVEGRGRYSEDLVCGDLSLLLTPSQATWLVELDCYAALLRMAHSGHPLKLIGFGELL